MSKVYVYEDLETVSNNWHSGGGAVIITDRSPQEVWHSHFTKKGLTNIAELKLPKPNQTIECSDSPEVVTIFMDAGCC